MSRKLRRNLGLATLASLVMILLANLVRAQSTFAIRSAAFASGGRIPEVYTCVGEDKSPALSWQSVPRSTKSLALIVADPDAPMGTFIHWVIYSIPASLNRLPEGVPKVSSIPGTGVQGTNSAGRIGYMGPCPPPGKPHHYHFRLYALDFTPNAKAGLEADELEKLMQGHILASTETVGIFSR